MTAHICDNDVTERLDSYTGALTYGSAEDLDQLLREQIYPTFWQTETGQKFDDQYIWDDRIQDRVSSLLKKKYGETGTPKSGVDYPGAVLVWRLESVIGDLMLIGDSALTTKASVEPRVPEPEQLRLAREKRNIQKEVQDDLGVGGFGGLSVEEINFKLRTRPEYKTEWYASRREQNIQESDLPEITHELRAFAEAFKTTPRHEMNLNGGTRRVAGISYGSDRFEKMLAQASAHNLI
jgi:hypothetical protein